MKTFWNLRLCLSLVALLICAASQAQFDSLWARGFGGSLYDRCHALVADDQGNAYALGYFKLQAGSLSSRGEEDVYLLKYNAQGQLIWATAAGGASDDIGYALALAPDQRRVYLTGYFRQTAIFGRDSLFSRGGADVFLAACDSNGRWAWAKSFGSPGEDFAYALGIDEQGQLYLGGSMEFQMPLRPGDTLRSQGESDVFLLKTNAQGQALAGLAFGGSTFDAAQALSLSAQGRLGLVGYFGGQFSLQGQTYTALGSSDAFVLCFDTLLQVQWGQAIGGSTTDNATALAWDDRENLSLVGNFENQIQLNGQNYLARGEYDLFLVQYQANGQLRWARTEGGIHDEKAFALCSDGQRFLYLAGAFEGTAYFGGDSITSRHNPFDAFVMKYSLDGHYQNALGMGGGQTDQALCLAYQAQQIWVGGVFQTIANFPPTLYANGLGDGFVASYRDTVQTVITSHNTPLSSPAPLAYPNPLQAGQLWLQAAEPCAWELYALSGQALAKGFCADFPCLLSLPNLPAGTYLLRSVGLLSLKPHRQIIIQP